MSAVNLNGRSVARNLAIALTFGLTVASLPVSAQAPNAKPPIEHGTAAGAKPKASDVEDKVKSTPVKTDTVTPKTDTANGATSTTAETEERTASGITAKQAQVTPLDTDDGEQEDFYATQSKQQIALLQQHEAVQHFEASKHYLKKWDTEMAELELRAAVMYMPSLKIAHRDYCLVAIMRGKPLRALAEFMMVIGLGEPVPFTEQQQQELRVENSQAHYKRGLESATKGKWDEAITELLWSRTYMPKDLAIHRSLAFAYASKGDFKMAEQYYQSTFQIDPNDAFAHADFANLLANKGHKEQAMAEMAKAVKADPDSTALHVDLGWLAESKGDFQKAEDEFRAALKRSPQYSALWYHLGQLLEKRGKTDEASAAYKTAIEKDSKNADARTALALLAKPVSSVAPPPPPPKANVTKPDGSAAVTPGATTPLQPKSKSSESKTESPAAQKGKI